MVAMMNAAEEAINAVYRELGCLACPHWKADAIRARIGAVYLAVERGESVTLPSRDVLTRGCCRRGDDRSVVVMGGLGTLAGTTVIT